MVSHEFQGEFIRENVVEHLDTVFVKTKLFPAVLGLRKYCFMHEIVICVSRPRNHSLTYREKNCRRGRLRPNQDNLEYINIFLCNRKFIIVIK
jgi:hypothetical protein